RHATNPLWNHYRCADDQWLALSMFPPAPYPSRSCEALAVPHLADDARFATMLDRITNTSGCIPVLDRVLRRRTRKRWIARARTGGDVILSIINSVDDLPHDPQMLANGYVTDFEHPSFGTTRVVGLPVRLSDTPGSIRTAAPEFGQHTEQILTEELGYSWEE